MNRFTISTNRFLNQEIQAFHHTAFFGYGQPNNPNYLNTLKNDNHQNWTEYQLTNAANQLRDILRVDLPQILQLLRINSLTACVIPRAKADNTYRENQLLFKTTVQAVVNQINGFEDGTSFISRRRNTRTTHLRRPIQGYVNDGPSPYPGITADTCDISHNVRGRNILLIDDIYTNTVNVDEDAIQALLNNGARSVAFYAVAQTVENHF